MTELPHESPQPSTVGEERLESWKEIARYLGRQVRTVQRWEKSEGLPVHRHQHRSGGSVFAHRTELDAWRDHRSTVLADPENPAVRRPGDTPPTNPPRAFPRPLLLAAATAFVALALWRLHPGDAEHSATRLAVLPFSVITETPPSEALRDGLTEEIITRLSRLAPERLAVIGRTSSMVYRERTRTLAEIGVELQVEAIVEGSIQIEGSKKRVSVRLLNAATQSQIWAGSVDLESTGLLDAQEEAARLVTRAVTTHLLGETTPDAEASPTLSPEAHEAFLQGRFLWHQGDQPGFTESIPFFEKATHLAPEFVEAHASLAHAHNLLGRYGMRPARDTFPLARECAERALALEPDHGEALAAKALVSFYWDWDFPEAEHTFLRAQANAPGSALVHHWYAHFLSAMCRHQEAIDQVTAAQRLEPLWPLVNADAAWFYFRARRYREAVEHCRRSLQVDPGFRSAASCLVHCLQRLGSDQEAWDEMRGFLERTGDLDQSAEIEKGNPTASLEAVYRRQLATLERAREERDIPPYSFAFLHAMLGHKDEAFEWLERAVEARDRSALLLQTHPLFDSLRDDPRFDPLVKEIGLPKP